MLHQINQKSYPLRRVLIGLIIASSTISFVEAQSEASRIYQTANPFVTSQEEALPARQKQTSKKNHSEQIPTAINSTGNFLHELNKSLYVQSEADVLFSSGNAVLSAKTIEHLDLIVKMFKRDINRHRIDFPNEQIVLLIDIKGYTDDKSFYYGQSIAERQAQNKLLSEERAVQVESYLRNKLKNTADVIEFQAVGLGETLPESKHDLNAQPSLRRSCKIYSLLYAERYTNSLVH